MNFEIKHIRWVVLIGGRAIEFTYLRALWHVGDRDVCAVAFILN